MKKIGALLSLLIFFSGCITTQDYNRLQNDVKNLYQIEERHHNQIDKRLNKLEDSITELKNKTESIISQQTDSVRSTQANLWSQFESQRVELATIKGKQELFAKRLKKITNTCANNTKRLNKVKKQISGIERNQQIMISQLGV
ncbi:MAG TPA: hypothetical protein VKN82_06010, partial [Desulfohalobiaceae bacterium]|nr:hypothetical protein [Desulfohalobiaceae bacterium]